MRIAVVGGTGPFGRALAARLQASGLEVIVGSRDADRAVAAALELHCIGEANPQAVADADFVVLAVNAEGALDTARELRDAIGETPVLSVASELRFSKEGVFPATDALSLAERIQAELSAPVAAGLHSLAASSARPNGPVPPTTATRTPSPGRSPRVGARRPRLSSTFASRRGRCRPSPERPPHR